MKLRSIALAALALIVWATPAAAQFGVRGGVNLTNFFGDDAADDKSRLGLNLGASFALLHFGAASVVPEVYYAQKGSMRDVLNPGSGAAERELKYSLAYVEIPVLLRVALPLGGARFSPYLQGGPVFGWNLDCQIEISDQSGSTENQCGDLQEENLETTIRNYEQGITFGAGTDIHLFGGMGALNLDARYVHGLSRLAKNSDIKNQAFTLMLGYSFAR